MNALTAEERAIYTNLLDNIEAGASIGLIRARLDGHEVAVIMGANEEDDGSAMIYPLAILVNDDLFERLEPPE